jgi:hypothetical protein
MRYGLYAVLLAMTVPNRTAERREGAQIAANWFLNAWNRKSKPLHRTDAVMAREEAVEGDEEGPWEALIN